MASGPTCPWRQTAATRPPCGHGSLPHTWAAELTEEPLFARTPAPRTPAPRSPDSGRLWQAPSHLERSFSKHAFHLGGVYLCRLHLHLNTHCIRPSTPQRARAEGLVNSTCPRSQCLGSSSCACGPCALCHVASAADSRPSCPVGWRPVE
ncbi:hypothetical protein DFH27DRAFT_147483 [Peziza echinospora]|nr:hypothetical protein DFH27DRAFT_147483 [Peziza echinospora]